MTDNRTTKLLKDYVFTLRRLEYDVDKPGSNMTLGEYEAEEKRVTDEYAQAIAATLGSDEPPYDELLRCLENDWSISASWDGLRKFWCIELTEEGMRLRDAEHGTLTAEQVREAIEKRFDFDVWVPAERWQAIADELNAEIDGTCKLEIVKDYKQGITITAWGTLCSECGAFYEFIDGRSWNCCPNCGRAANELPSL